MIRQRFGAHATMAFSFHPATRIVGRPLAIVFLVLAVPTVAIAQDVADVAPGDTTDMIPVVDGGLTARDVAAAAVETYPDVATAELAMREADLRVALARTSLLPRVDLSASYTRLSNIETPPLTFGGQSIESPFPQILDQFSVRATLTVPISDIFLRAMPGLRAVEDAVVVAQRQDEAARVVAAWQGAEAYYGWLRAVAMSNVAEASLALVESTTENVEALARAGVVPLIDVTTARASLEQARTAATQAELGAEFAATSVRVVAGWDEAMLLAPGEDVFGMSERPLPSLNAVVGEAMAQRAEAQALRRLRDVREQQLRVQRASSYPSLSVSASTVYANPNQRIVPSRSEFDGSWDITASVAWSPNDLHRNRVQLDIAELDIDRVDDDLRAFELSVRAEASQALAAWSQARAAISGARARVDAARAEVEARQVALQAGIGTTTELLQAQRVLASARLDLVDGLIAQRRAHVHIDRIEGRSVLD